MILVTGERMTGQKALPAINTVLIEPMEQQARGELVSKLAEMVDELAAPRSDNFELRFVNAGEEVESMIIPGAATRHQ